MAYALKTNHSQVSIFRKTQKKLGKMLAQYFPHNKVRIWGLKLCGFNVGKNVYVGQDLIVASMISEDSCFLKIGDRVAIGPRVIIVLSSDANWSRLMENREYIKSTVVIDDDCWIGAGAIIMPGISIGTCSIVGAGAIVTKDVDPYTVVAGNPAKLVKNIVK